MCVNVLIFVHTFRRSNTWISSKYFRALAPKLRAVALITRFTLLTLVSKRKLWTTSESILVIRPVCEGATSYKNQTWFGLLLLRVIISSAVIVANFQNWILMFRHHYYGLWFINQDSESHEIGLIMFLQILFRPELSRKKQFFRPFQFSNALWGFYV